MSRPRLYVFTISHFCEKARWALEHKGIDYELVTLLPGPHRAQLRKLVPTSRVPVLVHGSVVLQDSTPILDYIEERYPAAPLLPSDPELRAEVLHWEQLLSVEMGERVRRYVYAHAFKDARFVRALYYQDGPWWARPFYAVMLPAVFRAIRGMYGIEPEVVREDLLRLYDLFARLDARLATQPYVVGDTFTRADLSLAALAAPLLRPVGHPALWPSEDLIPPALASETRHLQNSRTAAYIRKLYRERRAPQRTQLREASDSAPEGFSSAPRVP